MAEPDILSSLGHIDIYLLDQLLRGRIAPGARILDLGCGAGRNVEYFLRRGYDVFGIDADETATASIRARASELAPGSTPDRFRAESIESSSFPDGFADVVVVSAVLHFARDDAHFDAMLDGAWRVLMPGGLFFCRLASTIGMESRMRLVEGRRFVSPDGVERFLVDEALLMERTSRLGGDLLDPIKTTVVQDQRSMTTWVLRKHGRGRSRGRGGAAAQ